MRVRVPATSANLGPGFDSLGLALSLYDEVVVRVRPEPGATVTVQGVGAGEVATDDTNLVVRAVRRGLEHAGVDQPGLELHATNAIPHGRGLGSSAAAIVAGLMAARGLLEGVVDLDASTLLSLATEMEGHPDNVAPALFGGLTIAWMTAEGPAYKRLLVHRGVAPVVFVPTSTLSTKLARSCNPRTSRTPTPRSTSPAPHCSSPRSSRAPSSCSPRPRTVCTRPTGPARCRRPTH